MIELQQPQVLSVTALNDSVRIYAPIAMTREEKVRLLSLALKYLTEEDNGDTRIPDGG